MGSKEKKRSKKASQGRKRKRELSKTRKRSSKKLRRHKDSHSESDEDSLSSASWGSFSSEEDVKRRRSSSRGMKDGKGRKKRARSSSHNSDSSSDSPWGKKRKSSKRKVDLSRKKKGSKKYRRAAILSSTSSDGSDYEKGKGRTRKKEMCRRYDKEDKSKRERKRNKSPSTSGGSERGKKRKRYWSPSDSSIGRSSASTDQHIQNEVEIHNRPIRKLNSIIVVAMELDQNTMSNGHENDLDLRDDQIRTESNIFEMGEQIEEKKSGTEAMARAPDNEDLESILRQKALENLKRFRGGTKVAEKPNKRVSESKELPNSENAAGQENIGGSDMKLSLSSELIQNESDEYPSLSVNNSSKELDLESCPEQGEILGNPSRNTENMSFKNHVEPLTGVATTAKHSEDNEGMIPKTSPIVNNFNPSQVGDIKSDSGDDVASRKWSVHSTKKLKSSQECLNATPAPSKCTPDKSGDAPTDEVDPVSVRNNNKKSNTDTANVPDNPSPSLPSTISGEHASSEHQGKAEEGSQFQEKTMSVMRGGELVQVSYKVYIPKKVSAVARRRLNR